MGEGAARHEVRDGHGFGDGFPFSERELSADERRFLATQADSVLAKQATDLASIVAQVRDAVASRPQAGDAA